MVRYICDKCGKELDIDKNLINLDFNSYSQAQYDLKEKTGGTKPEFQLCVECAYSVYRFVKKAKGGSSDGAKSADS